MNELGQRRKKPEGKGSRICKCLRQKRKVFKKLLSRSEPVKRDILASVNV